MAGLRVVLWGLLMAASASVQGIASDFENGQLITFEVKDLKTGKTYLVGDEDIAVVDGVVTKLTRYQTQDGKDVQLERSVYSFASLMLMAYSFENTQTGERVSLKTEKNTANIEVRDHGRAAARKGRYVWKPDSYMAKPLHHLIVRNWDGLTSKNKSYSFDLMVPSKMDSYGFRIRQNGVVKAKGQTLHKLTLEPTSWLARRFVGPMNFFYSPEKLLVKYEGVTTVAINGNTETLVRILFEYVDPASI